MEKVILDTSLLVDFTRNKADAVSSVKSLSEKFEICTTDINIFELYYGAYVSRQIDKNTAAIKGLINTMLVFSTTTESMEIAAKMLAELDKKGQKIEVRDVLIAGICLTNSCPIATQNRKHFERMGVKIVE